MKIKRFKNYITWRNKKGHFNTECNRASLPTDTCLTIPTTDMTKVAEKVERERNEFMLRIRKLTPKECMRLQGFSDENYNSIKDHFSGSAIYHVSGDAISITVLIALFGELTNLDYRTIINEYVENNIIELKQIEIAPTI